MNGASKTKVSLSIDPTKPLIRDMHKEKWELLEDATPEAGEFTLDLVEFVKPDEHWVRGAVMVQRAKEFGAALGQHHAEALVENQHIIPEEWREFYIIFPGTVWRTPHDNCSIPFIFWYAGRWYLSFSWIVHDWHSDARLVRARRLISSIS